MIKKIKFNKDLAGPGIKAFLVIPNQALCHTLKTFWHRYGSYC